MTPERKEEVRVAAAGGGGEGRTKHRESKGTRDRETNPDGRDESIMRQDG